MIVKTIVFGLGILCVISLLNSDFVMNYSFVWPGALILICLYTMLNNKRILLVPMIGLWVGILIFGVYCGFWDVSIYKLMLPGIFLILGIWIFLRIWQTKKIKKKLLLSKNSK